MWTTRQVGKHDCQMNRSELAKRRYERAFGHNPGLIFASGCAIVYLGLELAPRAGADPRQSSASLQDIQSRPLNH